MHPVGTLGITQLSLGIFMSARRSKGSVDINLKLPGPLFFTHPPVLSILLFICRLPPTLFYRTPGLVYVAEYKY